MMIQIVHRNLWVGLVLLCCSCSLSESNTERDHLSTLERVVADKEVRIGYANEAPYAYKDSKTGKLTGEAPEIARVLFNDMGVTKVEGVLTEFGALIPGLKAGRFDMIAAGMYIKPERCKEIAFSNPSYSIGEAIAVQSGNPKQLHSYENIGSRNDATIGVVAGSVERGYARNVGIPDDRIIVFPDAPSALEGVKAGRVDAYAGTSLTVQDLVDKDSSGAVERAIPFTDPLIDGKTVKGYGAFGFRMDDVTFREEFDRRMMGFIGSPEHRRIVRPFGFTDNELPGQVTASQLCIGD